MAILGIARSSEFGVRSPEQKRKTPNSLLPTPNSCGHLVTTKIEHDAILKAFRALEKDGFEATYLNVSSEGIVDPGDVEKALRPNTLLVSIGYANSEIGVIQPIAEMGKIVKKFRSDHQPPTTNHQPVFHSDASQTASFLDLDVRKLGVDLLTLNSSKVYGPKGIGCLYVRHGIELQPIIYGGGQEGGLRSGSENVPGIVGFAKALEIAEDERLQESGRLVGLRDSMIGRMLKEIPGAVLNGHATERLSNNINISVPGLDGETAVLYLSEQGVYVSTGSACTALSLDPSHVIAALGKQEEYTRGSLRFTLGRATTKDDIDRAIDSLKDVVKTLKYNG